MAPQPEEESEEGIVSDPEHEAEIGKNDDKIVNFDPVEEVVEVPSTTNATTRVYNDYGAPIEVWWRPPGGETDFQEDYRQCLFPDLTSGSAVLNISMKHDVCCKYGIDWSSEERKMSLKFLVRANNSAKQHCKEMVNTEAAKITIVNASWIISEGYEVDPWAGPEPVMAGMEGIDYHTPLQPSLKENPPLQMEERVESSHGAQNMLISTKGPGVCASFMLVLIGLKKLRSNLWPNQALSEPLMNRRCGVLD